MLETATWNSPDFYSFLLNALLSQKVKEIRCQELPNCSHRELLQVGEFL